MSEFESFNGFYRDALRAKVALDGALLALRDAGKRCRKERDAITARARAERPDVFEKMDEAYVHGERIKNAMQIGGRWPKRTDDKATRYSQILNAVPIDQRSPEASECLRWWIQFENAVAELEKLYPAPEHFWWNGPRVSGPSLYSDFGMSWSDSDA